MNCGCEFTGDGQDVVVMIYQKGNNLHYQMILSVRVVMATQYTGSKRLQHLKVYTWFVHLCVLSNNSVDTLEGLRYYLKLLFTK